jgi:hypothetical protein
MPFTMPDELETKINEVWEKSHPNHVPPAEVALDWLVKQTGLKEQNALKRLRKGIVARALDAKNRGDRSIFIEKIKRLAATMEPVAANSTQTIEVDASNAVTQESEA